MKPATLMLSTALASMMLLAPISLSQADAAGIKIKPQIVKVKPKIAVAKPRIRVKVKAAKIRVKAKIKIKAARINPRIKIKPLKAKIVRKIKVKPKLVVAPRVNLKTQLGVVGRIATNNLAAVKNPAGIYRGNPGHRSPTPITTLPYYPHMAHKIDLPKEVAPQRAVQRVATPTTNTSNTTSKRSSKKASKRVAGKIQTGYMKQADRSFDQFANHNGIRDAMNAARAAEAAGDVITLGNLRVAATPELGMPTRDLGSTVPSNQDILNGMTKEPAKTGTSTMNPDSLWGQNDTGGFGPDSFAGLGHTGSKGPANSNGTAASDAAKGFWGVTPERIEAGMGGIASGQGSDRPDKHNPQVTSETARSANERLIPTQTAGRSGDTYVDYREDQFGIKRTIIYDNDGQTIEETGIDGSRSVTRTSDNGVEVSFQPPGGVNELRDPDSGYSGSNPFPWIDETNKAELSTVGNGKTPGGLPAAPEQGEPTGWSTGTAMYSSSDLLERYDENSRNREERFKKPGNLCFHSEC